MSGKRSSLFLTLWVIVFKMTVLSLVVFADPPAEGICYALTSPSGTETRYKLVTLDLQNGPENLTETVLATIPNLPNPYLKLGTIGLIPYGDGDQHGLFTVYDDELFKIDIGSGELIRIGEERGLRYPPLEGVGAEDQIDSSEGVALTFDPLTGDFFALDYSTYSDGTPYWSHLFKIDPDTAEVVDGSFIYYSDYRKQYYPADAVSMWDPANSRYHLIKSLTLSPSFPIYFGDPPFLMGSTGNQFVTIDLFSTSWGLRGYPVGYPYPNNHNIRVLSYAPDGTLFGISGNEFVSVAYSRDSTALIVTPLKTLALENYWALECMLPTRNQIEGIVFSDTDGNGVQDAGESGIANAEVVIYRDGYHQRTFDQLRQKDWELARVQTDRAGQYSASVPAVGLYLAMLDPNGLPQRAKPSTAWSTPFEYRNGTQHRVDRYNFGVQVDATPSPAAKAGTCYRVDEIREGLSSQRLVWFDTTARQSSVIGFFPQGEYIDSLAYDFYRDQWYVSSGKKLGLLDVTTADVRWFNDEFGDIQGESGKITLNQLSGMTVNPYDGRLFAIMNKWWPPSSYGEPQPTAHPVPWAYPEQFNPSLLTTLDSTTGKALTNGFGPNRGYLNIFRDGKMTYIHEIAIDTETNAYYVLTENTLAVIDPATGLVQDRSKDGGWDGLPMRALAFGPSGQKLMENYEYYSVDCVPQSLYAFSGKIFDDQNRNHLLDAGEPPLENITVSVVEAKAGGATLASIRSADDGSFQLIVKYDGTVKLAINPNELPRDYILTTEQSKTIALAVPGDHRFQNNFGAASQTAAGPAVHVQGIVFKDLDQDGLIGSSERGVSQIRIDLFSDLDHDGRLTSSDGNSIDNTQTVSNGSYSFDLTTVGRYFVRAHFPEDASPTTPTTVSVLVAANDQWTQTIDFGFVAITPLQTMISGLVYHERIQVGIRDANEDGIKGITVYLYRDPNRTGMPETLPRNIIATAVTDDTGTYRFPISEDASYAVGINLPPGARLLSPWSRSHGIQVTSLSVSYDNNDFGLALISHVAGGGCSTSSDSPTRPLPLTIFILLLFFGRARLHRRAILTGINDGKRQVGGLQ